MYLKKVYISGFKSFAKPIQLKFSDDINAIVGPNGSGKSNISDAIRFVLGEQRTSQMRSHKMEDIIFSGTDAEKARGAAEVRLVLDRGEDSDLVISRKLYRTGESRYLINGKKVRLKDIQKLFYDTGLGKNGYSIVSQGGVDKIIGSNPAAIRDLVEEAVGIAGYKAKRVETQRHLEVTQDNIDRVEDILAEIVLQIKPLQSRAQKARRYLEINKILRSIDLVSFYSEMGTLSEKIKELSTDIARANTAIQDLENRSLEIDQSYLDTKESLKRKAEEINLIQNLIDRIKNTRTRINEARIREEALLENSERDTRSNQEELERVRAGLDRTIEQLNSYQDRIRENVILEEREREVISRLNGHVIEVEKELEKIKKKRREEELERDQFYERSRILSSKLVDLKAQDNKLSIQLNTLEDLKREYDEKRERSAEVSKALSEDKKYLENINIQLNQLSARKERLESEKDGILTDRERSRAEKLSLEDTYNYHQSLLDSHEGYSRAVRSLLAKAESNDEVYGVIGENFSVKPEYALAIETLIGNRAQNIVVEREDTARGLIELLKEKRIGRATFLPLRSLRVKKIPAGTKAKMSARPGFIGIAAELIETKPHLKLAYDSLLARSIVIDDFNNASAFRKAFNQFTLVTLDGEVFYPGGAIVGGKFQKKSRSALFQNSEIERLRGEIKAVQQKITAREADFKSIEKTLRETSESLQTLQEKRLKIITRINTRESERTALEQEEASLENELKAARNTDSELKRIQRDIADIETKLEGKHFKRSSQQKEEEVQRELDRLKEELTQSKLRYSTLEQKHENLDESTTRYHKLENLDSVTGLNIPKPTGTRGDFSVGSSVKTAGGFKRESSARVGFYG